MTSPSMCCLESMYKAVSGMLGEEGTADMTLVCGEERLRVHSFVLAARSPVFRSMLSLDMVERREGMVRMDDAEPAVVREMVSYLYTAEVRPEFGRLEELLVLANRYSVAPLVALVSSLLAATLSPATALRLGILGEAHQAEPLLEASARYIAGNLSSLGEETSAWMEAAGQSPRLTAAILEGVRLGLHRRVEVELCRGARRSTFGLTVSGGGLGPRPSAQTRSRAHLEFSVSWVGEKGQEGKPVFLVGLGVYTLPGPGERARGQVEVARCAGLAGGAPLAKLPVELRGVAGSAPCQPGSSLNFRVVQAVELARPVALQPGDRYKLSLQLEGTGFIYSGAACRPRVVVPVEHLGRTLEIVIHDWEAAGAGSFFQRLVLKTNV